MGDPDLPVHTPYITLREKMSSSSGEEENIEVRETANQEIGARFIQQHILRPSVPRVRLPRQISPRQLPLLTPTIPRPPHRPPTPSGMTPWSHPAQFSQGPPPTSQVGWQGGFQPWGMSQLSQQDADKMRLSSYGQPPFGMAPFGAPGPSSFSGSGGSAFSPPSANPFSRPGFSSHPREHLIQRAIQPGFERPGASGFDPIAAMPDVSVPSVSTTPGASPSKDLSRSPFSSYSPRSSYSSSSSVSPRGSGTLITRAEPDPGELTIEKSEPWAPSPGPSWAAGHPPSRPSLELAPTQTRPSPPS